MVWKKNDLTDALQMFAEWCNFDILNVNFFSVTINKSLWLVYSLEIFTDNINNLLQQNIKFENNICQKNFKAEKLIR